MGINYGVKRSGPNRLKKLDWLRQAFQLRSIMPKKFMLGRGKITKTEGRVNATDKQRQNIRLHIRSYGISIFDISQAPRQKRD